MVDKGWPTVAGMYFVSSKRKITATKVMLKKITHHHHVQRQPWESTT